MGLFDRGNDDPTNNCFIFQPHPPNKYSRDIFFRDEFHPRSIVLQILNSNVKKNELKEGVVAVLHI